MSSDTSEFFGGSIPAVKFGAEGDKITGIVVAKQIRQQTSVDTGELRTWPDGRPKLEALVDISLAPSDRDGEDDDGLRRLYVRGYMQPAIVAAVRESGQHDLNLGDLLSVIWVSTDAPARKGLDGAKRFEAELVPARQFRQQKAESKS